MLRTITPFRQLAKLYGSALRSATSLADIASAASIGAPIGTTQSQVAAEALAVAVRDMGEKLAASIQALPGRVDNPQLNLYHRLGLNLLLDRNSVVDRCVIDVGSWEPQQVEFLTRVMRRQLAIEPITFLDIGSYWGLYSLMAMRAGVQTIHTFEADRHNFSQMQAQVFLNSAVSEITPHFRAVTDKNGTVRFWDSRTHPDGNRGGVGIVGLQDERPSFEVPCVTIDDYLPLEDRFLVVKMDLEGHEATALRGMVNTFKRNRVLLQVEIFDQHAAESQPIIDALGLHRILRIEHDSYYANFDASYLFNA